MDDSGMAKLERMREDFQGVTGKPFSWSYCPILFRDEEVDLCKAHIVNKAHVSLSLEIHESVYQPGSHVLAYSVDYYRPRFPRWGRLHA